MSPAAQIEAAFRAASVSEGIDDLIDELTTQGTSRQRNNQFGPRINADKPCVFNPRSSAFMPWYTYYNFCRVHQSLRVTAAMKAGIAFTSGPCAILKRLEDAFGKEVAAAVRLNEVPKDMASATGRRFIIVNTHLQNTARP